MAGSVPRHACGTPVGDKRLALIGDRLADHAHDGDMLGRLAGDTFLAPDVSDGAPRAA
ncbi:MAG TPA: hypothetical protein VMY78_12535 [Solirubrobacteraceae bacterium]|nr:hypothetical protein [Solirubrobacteraceae bacterium]